MTGNVHHATRKAADKDLNESTITEQSHAAVLAGQMDLATARNIGADDAPTDAPEDRSGQDERQEAPQSASAEDHQGGADTPPQPVSRISKDDATQECWCGCRQWTNPNRRWRPGHDQRAKGVINRAVREGKVVELSPQLREYGRERGLI